MSPHQILNKNSYSDRKALRPSGVPRLALELLVKWVGASSPVGQDDREADSFEELGQSTDANGLEWSPFSENLGKESRSTGSSEDQTAKVSSPLIAQSASGIDESSDAI